MADAPLVIVDSVPFVLVVEPQQVAGVLVASGEQGPPGRDGLDGAEVSASADNQIKKLPDGLYVQPLSWETADW